MNDNNNFFDDISPVDGVPDYGAESCFKPPGKFSKRKISKKIIIPKAVREFNENELNIIHNLKYGDGKKLLKPSKRAKKQIALDHVLFTINLMELNGGNTVKGCMLAKHELGRMLGSVQTAQKVFDCLTGGGVVRENKHYNPDDHQARRYIITDNFKMINIIDQLKYKKTPKVDESPTITPEPIEITPEPVTIQQEPIQQEPEPMINEKTEEESIIEEIIKKSFSSFVRKRHIDNGFNPDEKKACSCCEEDMPLVMYSINNSGEINKKCKICWTLDKTSTVTEVRENDPMEIVKSVMMMIRKETPTQRSIRKLKEQMNHPDYVPVYS